MRRTRRVTDAVATRRTFGRLALTGMAAAALRRSQGAGLEDAGWIDAHAHVWTDDVKRYPLADGFTVEQMRPPSFTPQTLWRHARPNGVRRIVLIQMSYYRYDNRYMLDAMAASKGRFSGVGIVDHRAADVAARMKALAEHGVRGFRIHARGREAGKWLTEPGMAALWRTAAEEHLAVCPLINPQDIGVVDTLCRRHAGTPVVVDHFARVGTSGKIEPRRLEALCRLARHRHVHVKLSAFYALGAKTPPYTDLIPMIRRVVDAFGPSRLMWASDCPYQVQGKHS